MCVVEENEFCILHETYITLIHFNVNSQTLCTIMHVAKYRVIISNIFLH